MVCGFCRKHKVGKGEGERLTLFLNLCVPKDHTDKPNSFPFLVVMERGGSICSPSSDHTGRQIPATCCWKPGKEILA